MYIIQFTFYVKYLFKLGRYKYTKEYTLSITTCENFYTRINDVLTFNKKKSIISFCCCINEM